MSALVRDAGGKIHLLMKGADSVVMDRLAKDQSGGITKAQAMIDEVSRAVPPFPSSLLGRVCALWLLVQERSLRRSTVSGGAAGRRLRRVPSVALTNI